MSISASLRNWWYMLGSFFLISSSAFGSLFLIQEMSRNTPPCGLPRPSRISRTMQRATWSRVSSAGAEDVQQALLAVVPERAGDAVAVLHQRGEGVLHVHVDALVDSVVLQRA